MSAPSFRGLGARWSFPISARLLGEGNTGDSHIHFLEEVVSVLQMLMEPEMSARGQPWLLLSGDLLPGGLGTRTCVILVQPGNQC